MDSSYLLYSKPRKKIEVLKRFLNQLIKGGFWLQFLPEIKIHKRASAGDLPFPRYILFKCAVGFGSSSIRNPFNVVKDCSFM